jgi:hypothetical protein
MTIKNLVFGVCGFCVLTILYYYIFRTSPRFSDDASLLLAGSEMIGGNWRLHGWWLPIDNFWTNDIPLYALLAKLQGLKPVIMLQLPVLLWSLLCIVCLTLARTGLCKENRNWATIALATPIFLPVITDNGGMFQIAHAPIHVETTVGVLICFLLLKLFIDQNAYKRFLITGYGVVLTILLVADPLTIFIGVLPILCVAIFGAMLDRNAVRFWLMAAVTLLSGLLAKAILEINRQTGGFVPVPLPLKFASFETFCANCNIALHYFFVLFGCDFFGKNFRASPTTGPLLPLVRLPFLAFLGWTLTKVSQSLICAWKRRTNAIATTSNQYLDAMLAAAIVFNVASAVFTSQMNAGENTIRYFYPSLAFGAVLIARHLPPLKWVRSYFLGAALVSAILLGIVYARANQKAELVPPQIRHLATFLTRKNLTTGFGPYWACSILTVATREQVKARPICLDAAGALVPFLWQVNQEWYERQKFGQAEKIFVLAAEDGHFFAEKDVLRCFGEPLEKEQLAPYTVNVYAADGPRLRSIYLPISSGR